jgi:hypothetical protein
MQDILYFCNLTKRNNENKPTKMNILELSEQEIFRRESLNQLRELGIEPYPATMYKVDAYSTEIKENFN